VASDFQTGKNKIKLLMEYESVLSCIFLGAGLGVMGQFRDLFKFFKYLGLRIYFITPERILKSKR
jgi:hypothetical protein